MSAEKKFTCDWDGCGYRTAYSYALERHRLIHTGEKPYVCDFEGCAYKASQSENLTVHKRIHTGEKPYKCVECDYRTAHPCALTVHKRRHKNAYPTLVSIYLLEWKDGDSYVGSTVDVELRMKSHADDSCNPNMKVSVKIKADKNYTVDILETALCQNKAEGFQREREWQDNLEPTLNSIRATATKEETRAEESARKAERIVCECGAEICRGYLSQHKKTKKHQNFLKLK